MRSIVGALESEGIECIASDISGAEYKNAHKCLSSSETARLALGIPPDSRESNIVFSMKPEVRMRQLVIDHGMTLVGLHVGDVSEIPIEWKLIMEKEHLIVVPSSWMAGVVEKAGFSNVVVSRHGIEQEYLDAKASRTTPGTLRLLHFCSSGVFPERKSTPGVLRAFQRLVREKWHICLSLVLSELRKPIKKLLGALDLDARERLLVRTMPYGHSPLQLIDLYSSHDALVCPSRSEGFGIQPLEARALGLPVVQTLCTGMRDHLPQGVDPRSRGIIPVTHGDMIPAWGDFGLAPEVTDQAIYEGMLELIYTHSAIKEASENNADEMGIWSWKNQTHAFSDILKKEERSGKAI